MLDNTFSPFLIDDTKVLPSATELDPLIRSRAVSITNSPITNSDKCCGGTHNSTEGDYCYVLKSIDSNMGNSLGIETFYRDSGSGRMTKGVNISLQLPFRFPIADVETIKRIPINEQPIISGNLEWNPGLTSDGNTITTVLNNPTKYYELNLSAGELYHVRKYGFVLYNNWGGDFPEENIDVSDIKTHVLEPKMMVDEAGSVDYITISYNARVDLKGRLYHFERGNYKVDNPSAHMYWTVPYVIRFPISKAVIKNNSYRVQNRYYWTYGVDTAKQYNADISLNGISGDISTVSYDYALIPIARSMGETARGSNVFYPISWGCKTDIAINPDNNQVIMYSSLGYFNTNLLAFETRPIISRIQLSTYGFNLVTESLFTDDNRAVGVNRPCSKVSVSIQNNIILTSFSYTNTRVSSADGTTIVRLYDISAGLVNDGYSTKINNATAAISSPYLDGFVLSYTNSSTSVKVIFYPSSIARSYELNNNQYVNNSYKLLYLRSIRTPQPSVYNPFVPGKFWLDSILYKEIYSNLDNMGYTADVIPRPVSSGAIVIDIPIKTSDIRSKFYKVSNTDVNQRFLNFTNEIYTVYDSNEESEDDYFYITTKSSDFEYSVIDNVIDYKTYPITITGSIIQPEYWINPKFAESEVDGENRGVRMIISLLDCSGLYTAGTISGGDAWDVNARPAAIYPGKVIHGGIPLDPSRKRNDFDYLYTGTENGYQLQQPPDGSINASGDVKFGGSYSVVLKNSCNVNLTYKGYNILADSDIEGDLTIDLPCWKYNESGLFNAYLDLHLDLNGISGDGGTQFTEDGFTMSGCLLSVDLKNKLGYSISRFDEREVDIIPPSASGYINAITYKTIKRPSFILNRVVNPKAQNFTTIRNVKYNYYDYSTGELRAYFNSPSDFYKDSNHGGLPTQPLIFDPAIDLDKGDYVQVSYEPRLHDSRAAQGTVKFSEKVSYIGGHKFYIDNVKIEFSGDLGWNDVTDDISAGSVIYYNSISELNIRATYNAEHEIWPNRNELNDYQVYPYISGLYLFAIKSINLWDPSTYERVLPLHSTILTYPNHTDIFSLRLVQEYKNIKNKDAAATNVLYPNDTTLTSFSANTYSNEIVIDDPGQYQLYALIEDEFRQFSCFCITNIRNNYHIPFRSA